LRLEMQCIVSLINTKDKEDKSRTTHEGDK
jgi:hypothetical protein